MNLESDAEHERQEAIERLRREIQLGLDQLARGEYFDAEEVFEELLRGLPDPDEPDA